MYRFGKSRLAVLHAICSIRAVFGRLSTLTTSLLLNIHVHMNIIAPGNLISINIFHSSLYNGPGGTMLFNALAGRKFGTRLKSRTLILLSYGNSVSTIINESILLTPLYSL